MNANLSVAGGRTCPTYVIILSFPRHVFELSGRRHCSEGGLVRVAPIGALFAMETGTATGRVDLVLVAALGLSRRRHATTFREAVWLVIMTNLQ